MQHNVPRLPSTGEDPAERRRILNILAQRRYRQRKRQRLADLEAQAGVSTEQAEFCLDTQQVRSSLPISGQDLPTDPDSSEHPTSFGGVSVSPFDPSETFGGLSEFGLDPVGLDGGNESSLALSSSLGLEDLWPDFSQRPDQASSHRAITEAFSSTSGSAVAFPSTTSAGLNSGHSNTVFADYLITTPGVCFIRAHLEIFQVMHGQNFKMDLWNPKSLSPFNIAWSSTSTRLPSDFHPTTLQRSVQHHPVVDALPWPSFRDKFLYVMSLPQDLRPQIAHGDMPSVTMQLMCIMKDAGGGLRVWGSNPFDKESWEVGQLFYSKFWWAIDSDVVSNSNKLRLRRGEDVLKVKMHEV